MPRLLVSLRIILLLHWENLSFQTCPRLVFARQLLFDRSDFCSYALAQRKYVRCKTKEIPLKWAIELLNAQL